MARFCTACGHRLPAPDAPCPTCTGNGGDSLRADTSGDGRGKRISRKGDYRITRVTTTVAPSSNDAEQQAIDGVLEQELEDAIDSIAEASNG